MECSQSDYRPRNGNVALVKSLCLLIADIHFPIVFTESDFSDLLISYCDSTKSVLLERVISPEKCLLIESFSIFSSTSRKMRLPYFPPSELWLQRKFADYAVPAWLSVWWTIGKWVCYAFLFSIYRLRLNFDLSFTFLIHPWRFSAAGVCRSNFSTP